MRNQLYSDCLLLTEKFKENIEDKFECAGEFRIFYTFDNGYGASLIKSPYSYGLEMAIMVKTKNGYIVDLNNSVAKGDVISYLEPIELEDILEAISKLEKKQHA